jgi:hypothetical protein
MDDMLLMRNKVACGQVVGRSHIATSTPCQDYVAARNSRGVGCVALADGAGSRAHSELGAQEAVKATLRILSRDFDELYTLASSDNFSVASRVIAACHRALKKKAQTLSVDIGTLACTLMFAAHKNGRYLAGHLGDGIIAMETSPGVVEVLSRPDNGEFANTTVFVTELDAASRFRIYAGAHSASAFAVMSDGTAESLYMRSSGQPAQALQKLLQWNRELSKTKMQNILGANLEQVFAKKTTDDCSIGLLSIPAMRPINQLENIAVPVAPNN